MKDDDLLALLDAAAETMAVLFNHPWPGNVRELVNALRRACSLSDADVLRPADFAFLKSRSADRPEGGLISIDEHIREMVLRFGASLELQDIASRLGLSRKTLWEQKTKWGLS